MLGAGSSADRIARDQPRRGPLSAFGTPSRLPITSTGISAAKSSMRSTARLSAMRSSRLSTSATTLGSMRAIARWFTAPTISRRTRACSGGSLKTRLVVWCSKSGESPNFGPNSFFLSELARESR